MPPPDRWPPPDSRRSSPVTPHTCSCQRLRSPKVAALLAFVVLAMAVYAQLYSALPLLMVQIFHSESRAGGLVGTVFLVNSITVIALQVPVTTLVERRPGLRRFACAGAMVLYSAAFAVLLPAKGLLLVLGAVFLMSVGECAVLPLVESDLSAEVGPENLLRLFALSALAMGLGETVGSLVGVNFVARSPSLAHEYLVTTACLALVVAVCDAAASRRLHVPPVPAAGPHRSLPESPQAQPGRVVEVAGREHRSRRRAGGSGPARRSVERLGDKDGANRDGDVEIALDRRIARNLEGDAIP